MSDTITPGREVADRTRESTRNEGSSGGANAAAAAVTQDSAGSTPPGRRKRWLVLLAAAVLAGGAPYGTYYYPYSRYHESTDDAYVSGNLVQLTPQVSGTVVAVNADDTQIVKAGEAVDELSRGASDRAPTTSPPIEEPDSDGKHHGL